MTAPDTAATMPTDRPRGLAQTVPVGRAVTIGPDITVWVAEIRAGQARLVIDAPRELTIARTPRLTDERTSR